MPPSRLEILTVCYGASFYFCSVCCLTGVTVLFESVPLTVAENDSFVEACVVLLHTNLQQSFAIDLVPQSGTATSKSYYSAVLYGFENRE